jgi:isoamylase
LPSPTKIRFFSKSSAEPLDLGEGGYQVGNVPVGWAEWKLRYRNATRAYWKGNGGLINTAMKSC